MKNDLLGKWGKSDKNKVRFWFPGWSFKLGWRWFLLSAYSHFGHTCRNKNICWENSESSVCMYRPVVLGWTEGIKKGNLCRNVVLVPYRGRIFEHIKSHTFWVTKKIFWIFFLLAHFLLLNAPIVDNVSELHDQDHSPKQLLFTFSTACCKTGLVNHILFVCSLPMRLCEMIHYPWLLSLAR